MADGRIATAVETAVEFMKTVMAETDELRAHVERVPQPLDEQLPACTEAQLLRTERRRLHRQGLVGIISGKVVI